MNGKILPMNGKIIPSVLYQVFNLRNVGYIVEESPFYRGLLPSNMDVYVTLSK